MFREELEAAKRRVLKGGCRCEWVDRVIDVTEPDIVFMLNRRPYKSPCPFYNGYYLQGGFGAVSCARSVAALPGVLYYEKCEEGVCQLRDFIGGSEENNDNNL